MTDCEVNARNGLQKCTSVVPSHLCDDTVYKCWWDTSSHEKRIACYTTGWKPNGADWKEAGNKMNDCRYHASNKLQPCH